MVGGLEWVRSYSASEHRLFDMLPTQRMKSTVYAPLKQADQASEHCTDPM